MQVIKINFTHFRYVLIFQIFTYAQWTFDWSVFPDSELLLVELNLDLREVGVGTIIFGHVNNIYDLQVYSSKGRALFWSHRIIVKGVCHVCLFSIDVQKIKNFKF